MKDTQIKLDDGRELAYADIGDPDGAPIFFFHGTPMSRLHLVGLEDRLTAAGLRIIAPERPSYGRSSPQPGRSMADWPKDLARLADQLEIDRFIVAAHSGGGPYAVACAALLPDQVTAGAVFAGVTDMGWPDAWDGFVEDEVQIMREPDEAAAIAWCTEHYGADGNGFLAGNSFEFPEVDFSTLNDERFGQAVVEGFRQGVTGYAQDVHVQGRPWPFDPSPIVAPMRILHGEFDNLVPLAHSLHTAAVIPGSSLEILPEHGHLSTLAEFPVVASALRDA